MSKADFKRTIGLTTATSLVIGSIIGSGIFMRPAEMASILGSPLMILLVWLIAGIFTLFSAMVISEVAAMLPETGGQYAFLRHMYGDFWSYLYGWACFAVVNTAGTAGIAFICAEYAGYFFTFPHFHESIEKSVSFHVPFIGTIMPLENFGVKATTIILLGILTVVNYISTKLGGAVQVFFTVVKVMAIVFLAIGLFLSGNGSFSHFSAGSSSIIPAGFAMIAGFFAACNGGLQAYDGSQNLAYISGEIKQPGRNIPASLILGVTVCIFIYMAITTAMIYMLPVKTMAGSQLVASDAATAAFGNIGGGIIALLICLAVIGTTNASVMTPPRITFAMAREGRFFHWAGKINPRFQTPGNALLLHFIWMIPMVLSGSFFILADMYIFIVWLFNLLIIAGLFILRRKMPDAVRPYKVWGYPWMPALLIIFNGMYLGMTLYNDINNYLDGKTHIINSVFGIALTAIGIPLFWYFKRRNLKV